MRAAKAIAQWLEEHEATPAKRPVNGLGREGDWPEVVAADEVTATALLDRLLHRSHVINTKGRSYWLRDLERPVK